MLYMAYTMYMYVLHDDASILHDIRFTKMMIIRFDLDFCNQFCCSLFLFCFVCVQLICFNSLDLWSALTSSQAIKTSPVFLSVLPQLLPALRSKQLKVSTTDTL